MSEVNCTITIHDEESLKYEAQYRNERGELVTDHHEGKLGGETELARLTVERLNYWLNFSIRFHEEKKRMENPCTLEDLKVLGVNLSKIIFSDENIREQFAKHYREFNPKDPNSHLRLRLIFERGAARLAGLPWEFLFVSLSDDIHDGFFIAGQKSQLTLARFVPESKLIKELKPLQEKRLKILLICSNPQGLDGSIDTEVADEVYNRVKDLPSAEVLRVDDKTFADLDELIYCPSRHGEDHKDFCPHIVHFIGHGEEGKLALVKSREDHDYNQKLADDGKKMQARWIDKRQMGILFADRGLRLIFLHACKGAAPTTLNGFKSTAGYLADLRIPAVVVMQYNIFNVDAGIFARTFYEEIGKGKGIDEAVEAGRVQLNEQMPPWYPRFGAPAVYLHSNEAAIISPGAAGERQAGK